VEFGDRSVGAEVLGVRLAAVLLTFAAGASAQIRTLGVCEALNSTISGEEVVIRGRFTRWVHGTAFFEGLKIETCPGWRARLFTAPAAIGVEFVSTPEAHTPVTRDAALEFLRRIMGQSVSGTFTSANFSMKGMLVKKFWPCVFRGRDGQWSGLGFGGNGKYLAELVMTEVPSEP
jgi:hypothetical protein